MEKYFKIIEEIRKAKVNETELYLLECLYKGDKELAVQQMNYCYDLCLSTDTDLSLARLCDVVIDNWGKIQEDEMTDEDIIEIILDILGL